MSDAPSNPPADVIEFKIGLGKALLSADLEVRHGRHVPDWVVNNASDQANIAAAEAWRTHYEDELAGVAGIVNRALPYLPEDTEGALNSLINDYDEDTYGVMVLHKVHHAALRPGCGHDGAQGGTSPVQAESGGDRGFLRRDLAISRMGRRNMRPLPDFFIPNRDKKTKYCIAPIGICIHTYKPKNSGKNSPVNVIVLSNINSPNASVVGVIR